MSERADMTHPSPPRLAAWREGRLSPAETAEVARHHAACPLCRLETRRQERFVELDADAELAAEADWGGAELALQRAFERKVRPAIAARHRRRLLWLAPAAAAAVLLLFVARVDRLPPPGVGPGRDTLRGGEPTAIALVAPLGELAMAPASFRWRAEAADDAYTLTVFTPGLATVLRLETARADSLALPDSLRARFAPGVTYLWSVEGRRGLDVTTASGNGWFRIGPPR